MSNAIISKLSGTFSKIGFILRKRSPEILLIGGVSGLVTSGILACRSSRKVDAIINTKNTKKKEILKLDTDEQKSLKELSKDEKKELGIAYVRFTEDFAKLYALPIGLGVLSITSILVSHKIIKKRNLHLAATLAGVTQTFSEYRSRVAAKYGEEEELAIRYGKEKVSITDTVVDENGKEKKVKNKEEVFNPNSLGIFAGYFDASCRNWQGLMEYDLNFLKMVEKQLTDRLVLHGHLFLNEVYDAIGMERTSIGQYAGWVYDENDDRSDNYVDLGIDIGKYLHDERTASAIVIDPNCDGYIMDRVFTEKGHLKL